MLRSYENILVARHATNPVENAIGKVYAEAHHGELLHGRFTFRGKHIDVPVTSRKFQN